MTERRGMRRLRMTIRTDGRLAGLFPEATGPGASAAPPPAIPVEFHVAAEARRKYRFAEAVFQSSGNVVLADFRAVREFAARMNERRAPGEPAVRAGELNAMGLIDEILHFVFRSWESTAEPGILRRAIASLESSLGHRGVRTTIHAFTGRFPPVAVFRGERSAADWLAGTSAGRPHPEIALEEILMLHLANRNPAFGRFRELHDESGLAGESSYGAVMEGLRSFLASAKPFGPGKGMSILDLLEEPMRAHPENLTAQLGFIRDRWGIILSDEYRRKVLSSEDLAREDEKAFPAGGAGPALAPDYSAAAAGELAAWPEPENFTHDTDWMPNVVLLAKNAYVWLHQLSREYGRRIERLDEVPDGELDRIAARNFTSLWLIGVWHRSEASARIKRLTGNPEAAPSAYSLFEYEIAPDLGGEQAFGNLSHRAWVRGIRLAADMVPNHTGIASRWMRERPDYFVQSDHPPFPSYRFTGPDLSGDPDYQVRIEDGYWTRTDAAVVFQRIDNRTGRMSHVYHGNDGTNMPWNDTAQLDFLKPEVREAVIGQILHVARKFSVIRFDAAMTLTRKHFQRLWYPQPGTGGDIPSRADHAMTRAEFEERMPAEFWREVVDRINRELPQTLLLAEAFWLLEGFFVRTLGMHRVYNSAFMHMLMKEDNAMYRGAIRSTLHFNPEILKRYVNFMSNPDEKTAIEQFGKGDKYFGVATLLVTIPGLPMFAHGQVEGFREKYGMEYRRDYHDERPDHDLVRRHEREIFPLVGMRRLFSQTEHFELYDVVSPGGGIAEDIFAHSNMAGSERALVCYNNRYEPSSGTIRHSTGKLAGGSVRSLALGDALRLRRDGDLYYIFTEQRSGLDYFRTGSELHEQGFFVRLNGYETQVFLNFREARDEDGSLSRLHAELGGAGVRDAFRAARAIGLRPFTGAFTALFEPEILDGLGRWMESARAVRPPVRAEIAERMARLAEEAAKLPGAGRDGRGGHSAGKATGKSAKRKGAPRTTSGGETPAASRLPRKSSEEPGAFLAAELDRLRTFLAALGKAAGAATGDDARADAGGLAAPPRDRERIVRTFHAFLVVKALAGTEAGDGTGSRVRDEDADRWMLTEALTAAFGRTSDDAGDNARQALLVRALLLPPTSAEKDPADATTGAPVAGIAAATARLFDDPFAGRLLGVHEHEGVRWFNRESLEEVVGMLTLREAFARGAASRYRGPRWTETVRELREEGRAILEAAEASGYRAGTFLDGLQSGEFRTLPAGTDHGTPRHS